MRWAALIGLALGAHARRRLDKLVVVNGWARPDPHFTALLRHSAGACCASSGARAYLRAQPHLPLSGALDFANDARTRSTRRRHASSRISRRVEMIEKRIAARARLRPRSRLDDIVTPTCWSSPPRTTCWCRPHCSERLAEELCDATLATMDWGGHACNVTDPDNFNRIVLDCPRGAEELMMEVGIFMPIGNNGWLISENSPQYMPSFDLNKEIAQKAESYGVDFLLSMIKLRGFGGKTEFWEYNLESFTLMAGLAAVTEKIRIYATCPTLVIPPAFCARMCNTIDSISHGRFGLNLITGWQRPEYSQMGLWPGDEHFRNRYQMLGEYAHILRELWATGQSPTSRANITRWRIAGSGRCPRAR